MSLADKLQETALSELDYCNTVFLADTDLAAAYPTLYDYFRKNSGALKALFDNGILLYPYLDILLKKKIVAEAQLYIKIMNNPKFPVFADHISRTDFLAYALETKTLPQAEIRRIRFDHGHDVDSYIKEYRNPVLIESVRKNLLELLK